MNFIQVSIAEAITRANTGAQIYMLMPVHPGTTAEELNASNGYVVPEEKKKPGPKPKSKGGAKPKVDDDELASMWAGKATVEFLAEHFGVTKTTIRDRLKKMGVYESPKKIDDGKLKALYTANPPWPITKIADEMGISPQTVYNHLEKMGLYRKGGDAK